MTTDLHTRILVLLEGSGIPFDHFEHEHVHTSQEAARARGTNIEDAARRWYSKPGRESLSSALSRVTAELI